MPRIACPSVLFSTSFFIIQGIIGFMEAESTCRLTIHIRININSVLGGVQMVLPLLQELDSPTMTQLASRNPRSQFLHARRSHR